MTREFTCIVCPNGCDVTVDYEIGADQKPIIHAVYGNTCKRGEEYVTQELTSPMRTIASSVLVNGGELPLVSVRLTKAIPKERLFDAMAEIRQIRVDAPVQAGTVLLPHILGYESDVIATKNVNAG